MSTSADTRDDFDSQAFIAALESVFNDPSRRRHALPALLETLNHPLGEYAPAREFVEKYVLGADNATREAAYLTAALYALHPMHRPGTCLATALGTLPPSHHVRNTFSSILGASRRSAASQLPDLIRQLAKAHIGLDYADLANSLARWDAPDKPQAQWARAYTTPARDGEEAPRGPDNTPSSQG